jgi:hypothetical protein
VSVVRVAKIVKGIARKEPEMGEVGETTEVGEAGQTTDACGVGGEGLRPHWWGLGA